MIRTCNSCGKSNRVPMSRLADAGKCGACKAPLGPTDVPVDVGPDELRQIVASARVPVLVDFWAQWCGPCRMAAPEVERVAQRMRGRALVLKVDTERHPGLADELQVRSIPTFAVLKGGDLVRRQAGLVDHRTMERWLIEAGA